MNSLIAHFPFRPSSRFGLTNLQRVSASGVGLTRVDPLALAGLSNLVELDLSDNALNEVPSAALNTDAGSLMSLSLRANVIPTIRSRAFHR